MVWQTGTCAPKREAPNIPSLYHDNDENYFHTIKVIVITAAIIYTKEESISELNRVATVWIVEGTHSKDFRGIPATHKKFDTAGVSIFHFEGNKIKEAWTIVDGLTAALQVGAVEKVSNETD